MVSYLSEIWRCRFFWFGLVKLDLRKRYRRSVLGVGWSLVHPVAMTAILCAVFSRFYKAEVWQLAPYLLSGLACWQYLSMNINWGCHTFFQGESFIRQYPAPSAIYSLRTTLTVGTQFLISLGVVLGFTGFAAGFANPLG